jgi:hypothetical protein
VTVVTCAASAGIVLESIGCQLWPGAEVMASEIVGVGGAYNFPYLVKRRQMGGRGMGRPAEDCAVREGKREGRGGGGMRAYGPVPLPPRKEGRQAPEPASEANTAQGRLTQWTTTSGPRRPARRTDPHPGQPVASVNHR